MSIMSSCHPYISVDLTVFVLASGLTFVQELAVFRKLQVMIRDVCSQHNMHPACVWYKLNDMQFLRMISVANYTTEAVPFNIPS